MVFVNDSVEIGETAASSSWVQDQVQLDDDWPSGVKRQPRGKRSSGA